MAHIEYSPISHSTMLYLSRKDAKVLIPGIESALTKSLRQEAKYRDIHESGEASDRDDLKLVEAEETSNRLKDLLAKAKQMAEQSVG